MKKFFYLLFALLLFAGAVHAQTTDDSWWNDPFGQMDIELLNDEGQPVDSLAVWLSSTDVIYIGHKDPFYYQRLAMLGKHDPAMVVITRENNDTIFKKDLSKPSIQIQLNYLLIPSGEYTLNVYWHDTWWRGEFAFKSHWPEGQAAYIDSTYYRLKGRYATTVWPDYAGKSITFRKLYDLFERDYPLHVVIPSELTYEGETYQVVGIEHKSFKWCYYLLSVTLPNTITFIDQGAFMECVNLRRIDIPESVTSIGTGVFDGCVKLSYIEIPEGITAIKDHTFNCCTSLSAVTLPSSLTTIERLAFSGCTSLPYIDIPDGVTSIGEYAFSDCENLMGIKLPRELTQIDNHAFYNCKMLTSIEIPEFVRTIDDYAFYKCAKLASVTLPENMTKIGEKAFFDMPSSGHIYSDAKEPFTISENTFNYKCTLHVPYGCKDKYQKAANWKNFTKIEEMEAEEYDEPAYGDETGVAPAVSDDAASDGQFYDLQGRPSDGTRKGFYIQGGKKVLVK
ncbi:MAG: leucine-rich repeat domain-containing protein [Bacteroidaceae bacterium]|nr:leucine-rich repeat domain-containing protein [Bacteroidaceae bacterium]